MSRRSVWPGFYAVRDLLQRGGRRSLHSAVPGRDPARNLGGRGGRDRARRGEPPPGTDPPGAGNGVPADSRREPRLRPGRGRGRCPRRAGVVSAPGPHSFSAADRADPPPIRPASWGHRRSRGCAIERTQADAWSLRGGFRLQRGGDDRRGRAAAARYRSDAWVCAALAPATGTARTARTTRTTRRTTAAPAVEGSAGPTRARWPRS